ncbi:GntR family transcriptional regulator [Paenibacillus ginsengarvi]|uniref:GntR family transcriptional regulator n=2 Tax=Paenibacillus ginsengarvi TaxID=400777 RepID=A0A3B0AYG1_9BACL|nr:GntR family transcriptional regulator [Paenibacillus ginsengarvi]
MEPKMDQPMQNQPLIIQKQNISEELVKYIKQQIISGELNPGDRIVETKLARELGVSQTPVREAIRHLHGEGVITIVPNKGPMVRTLDMKDVFEIYSVRSMLEGLAIRLATQNATDAQIAELESFYEQMKLKLNDDSVSSLLYDSSHIHKTIIEMAGHDRLMNMYQSISFQISLVNRLLGARSTKQKEVDQHLELIEVLKKRNPDEAETTMRKHIFRSYRDFVQLSEKRDQPLQFDEKLWI